MYQYVFNETSALRQRQIGFCNVVEIQYEMSLQSTVGKRLIFCTSSFYIWLVSKWKKFLLQTVSLPLPLYLSGQGQIIYLISKLTWFICKTFIWSFIQFSYFLVKLYIYYLHCIQKMAMWSLLSSDIVCSNFSIIFGYNYFCFPQVWHSRARLLSWERL